MSETSNITSQHVARNIASAREHKKMSYAELSRRTQATGHALPVLALQRIEKGERRIDVDDLTTLAAVLEISVIELLTPAIYPEGPDAKEEFTDDSVPLLSGLPPLTYFETTSWLDGKLKDFSREARWQLNANILDRSKEDLEKVEDDIERIGTNTEEGYNLRGHALHIEQEIHYLTEQVESLRETS